MIRVGAPTPTDASRPTARPPPPADASPSQTRAQAALDQIPCRLGTPLLFPSPAGHYLDLSNFRAREWRPALAAGGIPTGPPATCATASRATRRPPASSIFELARYMGTSIRMINRTTATSSAAPSTPSGQSSTPARIGQASIGRRITTEESTGERAYPSFAARTSSGSDGTRTRDLRRDRPIRARWPTWRSMRQRPRYERSRAAGRCRRGG
jgi:hypothetical protein